MLQFELASDGGIVVDGQMRTSVAHVYAAGDICTAAWKHSPFWLQVTRLHQTHSKKSISNKDRHLLHPKVFHRPNVADWGSGMSAAGRPQVQLFADAGSGWLHNALHCH